MKLTVLERQLLHFVVLNIGGGKKVNSCGVIDREKCIKTKKTVFSKRHTGSAEATGLAGGTSATSRKEKNSINLNWNFRMKFPRYIRKKTNWRSEAVPPDGHAAGSTFSMCK